MKKLIISGLMMMLVLTLGFGISRASEEDFTVTFTARFDHENTGDPLSITDRVYGSRIVLEEHLETEDYTFAFWIVNGVVRFDLPSTHAFVITRDMEIEAVHSQDGVHAVIFMDSNGKHLGVEYVEDGEDASDITEGLPSKPHYKISTTDKWSGPLLNITEDGVRVLQYEIDTTTEFTLTIVGEDPVDYLYNTVVTLEADPGEEEYFHYWKRDGFIASYCETYKFTMMKDTEIEAVYGASPVTPEAVMFLSEPLTLRDGYTSYVAQFYLPEGYELIELGILTLDGVYVDFEKESNIPDPITIDQIGKFYGPTNEFLVTFSSDEVMSGRSFLVFENNSDLFTVYSSILETRMVKITSQIGMPTSKMQVYDFDGGFVQEFSMYADGVFEDSTSNGELTIFNEMLNTERYRVVIEIDGRYYPWEVE